MSQTITLDRTEYTAETGADLYVVTAMEWVEHDIGNRLDELGLEVVGDMPCIDAVYVKRRYPNDPLRKPKLEKLKQLLAEI